MKITPSFVVTFETELVGLQTGNWQRVAANLNWDRWMKTRPMSTKTEILTWLLESAQIYPEGNGGNKRFDDMVAATMSYEYSRSGSGLHLTRDEIQDNAMKDNPRVNALDYASKWAKDSGAAAAYEPQKQLFNLMLSGKTETGYDHVAFYDANHPVDPSKPNGTKYSNLITNVPLVVTTGATETDNLLIGRKNLGKALATIRGQKFINGVPRFLVPTTLLVQSSQYDYANLIVNAGIIGLTDNLSAADTKTQRKLEVIAAPEIDGEPDGTYFIGVEDILSDELGAFIWGEREPYTMTTYGPMNDYELKRMKKFAWELDGANVALFGHPYLHYRCEPT